MNLRRLMHFLLVLGLFLFLTGGIVFTYTVFEEFVSLSLKIIGGADWPTFKGVFFEMRSGIPAWIARAGIFALIFAFSIKIALKRTSSSRGES